MLKVQHITGAYTGGFLGSAETPFQINDVHSTCGWYIVCAVIHLRNCMDLFVQLYMLPRSGAPFLEPQNMCCMVDLIGVITHDNPPLRPLIHYAFLCFLSDDALIEELTRKLPPQLIISSGKIRMLNISLGQGSKLSL